MTATQHQIDAANSDFWNELCGTIEAKRLGITDSSKESLAKFDSWYLEFYPYLLPIVQPERMKGKQVLEIGLGYGTVGQVIAAAGADYTGMDIARNPVENMNYRLRLRGLPGRATQGSALAMPFPEASFDFVVSIGCLHHTGNLQKAFDEVFRVLRPGGTAVMMVYNKYSYMRWKRAPWSTFKEWWHGWFRGPAPAALDSTRCRGDYDANTQGMAAPEVALTSVSELKRMLAAFEKVSCTKHNANQFAPKGIKLIPRPWLLPTMGRLMGLDIYIEARKGKNASTAMAAA